MPNPVEGLLEVYEDVARSCWYWRCFTRDSRFEDLVCGAPSCSEARLFFSNTLLHLRLQSICVLFDLQHDFAWVPVEADRSVVVALLQVAFLGKCDDQGWGPRGWPFSFLPDLVVD